MCADIHHVNPLRPEPNLWCLLLSFPPDFGELFSLNLALTDRLERLATTPESPLSLLSLLGLQPCNTPTRYLRGCWDLSSGPHAYTSSFLGLWLVFPLLSGDTQYSRDIGTKLMLVTKLRNRNIYKMTIGFYFCPHCPLILVLFRILVGGHSHCYRAQS